MLSNECGITRAYDPKAPPAPLPPVARFRAIWDTGATNTVISANVVKQCGLTASGMAKTHGVHGPQTVSTYLANVYLPNSVGFSAVRVTEGNIGDHDILIGMDIIGAGDFAITHPNGNTKFSFRMPSQGNIDFVESDNRTGAPKTSGGNRKKPKRKKRNK